VSRLNHACAPNLGYYFDSATLSHRVYAVKDILPGEELTISYVEYVLLIIFHLPSAPDALPNPLSIPSLPPLSPLLPFHPPLLPPSLSPINPIPFSPQPLAWY
jgi:hypothetical protein